MQASLIPVLLLYRSYMPLRRTVGAMAAPTVFHEGILLLAILLSCVYV